MCQHIALWTKYLAWIISYFRMHILQWSRAAESNYCEISSISAHQNPENYMFLVSSYSCLYQIHRSQVLSPEWWCIWSSAGRRGSNYMWVINKIITYLGKAYIRGLTVHESIMRAFTYNVCINGSQSFNIILEHPKILWETSYDIITNI